MTDEALMRAVRDGDLGKLGMLFERHHVALFDFLSRMTGDRTAAEDLTQDVFVRMLKYRGTYRDDGRFETWMFHIARNARADYFRRRAAVELKDEGIDAATPTPPQVYEPFAQQPRPGFHVLLRAPGPPLSFAETVRHEVRAIDSAQPYRRRGSWRRSSPAR